MRDSIHPAVHAILHVQEGEIFDGYFSKPYETEYLNRLERNANIFRQRKTPVILVGCTSRGDGEHLCSLADDVEAKSPSLRVNDLLIPGKRGDIVCTGPGEHPFGNPLFMDLLKIWQTRTVILVGGYTSACIGDAICRATDNNLRVKVVLDGLVDCNYDPGAGSSLKRYCDEQESILDQTCDYRLNDLPNVEKTTYGEIFNPPTILGGNEPVRWQRPAPAHLRTADI